MRPPVLSRCGRQRAGERRLHALACPRPGGACSGAAVLHHLLVALDALGRGRRAVGLARVVGADAAEVAHPAEGGLLGAQPRLLASESIKFAMARGRSCLSWAPAWALAVLLPSCSWHCHWQAAALDNGLGLTPPMGYNAYDHVGCCANESNLKATASAILSQGLDKLGYEYVNMDCGWMGGRFPNGTLFESATKFPSGMRALADWLHARGLKLGVYSDRGTHDFSGSGLGMKGHEAQDASWMASVGVDYLKVDDMSGTPRTTAGARADYERIRDALNATGRPIFFSTCGH